MVWGMNLKGAVLHLRATRNPDGGAGRAHVDEMVEAADGAVHAEGLGPANMAICMPLPA